MLVLSRQRDETIMIGDEIEITVVDIRGDKVRLGITAPTKVAVHRKEVYDAIKRENEAAAGIRSGDFSAMRPGIPGGPARAASRSKASQLSAGQSGPVNKEPFQSPRPGDDPSAGVGKPFAKGPQSGHDGASRPNIRAQGA